MLSVTGQMEELVGTSFHHHCLGRKHTEMSGGLWVSAFIMFFHVSKSIAKLLKFSFACVCPQRESFLPELPLKTKLSLNSAKLQLIFHRPIVYLWKTNWQLITLQLLRSLTVPQIRDYVLQINMNSLTAFDLPCEPVATSLFPFVRTTFFLPTRMGNGRHPVASGWWRHCAGPWQSLPAGSSELPTSPGPGFIPGSCCCTAELLVHSLVVRRALGLSPQLKLFTVVCVHTPKRGENRSLLLEAMHMVSILFMSIEPKCWDLARLDIDCSERCSVHSTWGKISRYY